MVRVSMALVCALLLTPVAAHADEVVHLVDKTRIVGKLLHYYDGVFSLQLANGAVMKLPREKVRRVQLKLPKARKALSSPRKAFSRLRDAALKGDVDTYVDAHSAYYQMFLSHQISQATPAEFRRQLKKEWTNVQLEVVGADIKGSMATLKVKRRNNTQSEEGEFRFVKENGEWKMILPL